MFYIAFISLILEIILVYFELKDEIHVNVGFPNI